MLTADGMGSSASIVAWCGMASRSLRRVEGCSIAKRAVISVVDRDGYELPGVNRLPEANGRLQHGTLEHLMHRDRLAGAEFPALVIRIRTGMGRGIRVGDGIAGIHDAPANQL